MQLMHKLAEGNLPPAMAGALLAGLRAKGETADEIRGFATAMRELALHPAIPDGAPTVDTVGTGGDGSGSLNLSTGAGLLAAAAGVARGQARQPLDIEQVRQRRCARVSRHAVAAARRRSGRLPRGNAVYLPVRARLSPGDEGDHARAHGARRCARYSICSAR